MSNCCPLVKEFMSDSFAFLQSDERSGTQKFIGGLSFFILSVTSGLLFFGYQCYKHFWVNRDVKVNSGAPTPSARVQLKTQGMLSADEKYTKCCYDLVNNRFLSDKPIFLESIFIRSYPKKTNNYPIIVPRLNFFESQKFQKEDLDWIVTILIKFLCIKRRGNTCIIDRDFRDSQVVPYATQLEQLPEPNQTYVCDEIINFVKNNTDLREYASNCLGMHFLDSFRDVYIKYKGTTNLTTFQNRIYTPLSQWFHANYKSP